MNCSQNSSGSTLRLKRILMFYEKIVKEKIEGNIDSLYIFQIERRQGILKERALAIGTRAVT